MRNRTDQGIAQRFGLRTDPRVADGLAKIKVLERRGRVAQHRVDPLPDGIDGLPRALPEIDRQHAEIAGFAGHGANQPEVPLTIVDDACVAGLLAADSHRLGLAR